MTPTISKIFYKAGYKYQLQQPVLIQTDIIGHQCLDDFMVLTETGSLGLLPGYAWNGANVVPDERKVMRGSLIHDALYQLLQRGLIPQHHKDTADRLFQQIIVEDGMSQLRALAYYWAVSKYGDTGRCREVIKEAP